MIFIYSMLAPRIVIDTKNIIQDSNNKIIKIGKKSLLIGFKVEEY